MQQNTHLLPEAVIASWDKDFSKVTANITVNAVWTDNQAWKGYKLNSRIRKEIYCFIMGWDRIRRLLSGIQKSRFRKRIYSGSKNNKEFFGADSKAVPGTQYSYKVVAVRSLSGKKYQGAESDVVTTKIGTPQIGDTYSVGDLNYKLTGTKEVTVTGLAKVTDTLVIPSSVTISGKVYKVTAIQDKAFYRNEIL